MGKSTMAACLVGIHVADARRQLQAAAAAPEQRHLVAQHQRVLLQQRVRDRAPRRRQHLRRERF